MKKVQMILVVLVVALVALQGATLAGTVSGTVKSVDAVAKKLEIATDMGSSWVEYGDATTWPAGVTDPASLVDKTVDVTTDDVTGVATAVAEAEAEAEAGM